MNDNYPQKRLTELDNQRADLFKQIKYLEQKIKDCRAEIDIIDIRYADAEEFAREWPKTPGPLQCVPAPSTKIQVKETAKPKGISTPVNTENVIGDKTNLVYFLQKKNEVGMADTRNKLVIAKDQLDSIVDAIKERGYVHFDEFEGVNIMKHHILALFLNDSFGDYTNVKYKKLEGNKTASGKKYLVWENP